MIVNKDEYSEEDINIILFESINLMFNLTTKYMEFTNNDRYRNRDKFLMMIDY